MRPFFAVAFGITWSLQGIVIAFPSGLDLPLLALAGVSPSLAALVVTRGRVLSSLRPRVAAGWLAVSFTLPLLVRLIVGRLAPGAAEAQAVGVVALGSILLPPLGEELGWRGFALPGLADRIGFHRANLVVAAAWALWHLPTALFPGARLADFPLYALAVMAGGVVIGEIQRRGGGNVVLAMTAHATMNAAAIFVAVPDNRAARLGSVAIWIALAAALSFVSARRVRV